MFDDTMKVVTVIGACLPHHYHMKLFSEPSITVSKYQSVEKVFEVTKVLFRSIIINPKSIVFLFLGKGHV
jgi:hypothetical protein